MYGKNRRKCLVMFLTLAMVVSLTPAATLTVSADTAKQEIVFIENNVADYQMLADGVTHGAEIHILDSNQSGLEQIAGILEGRCGIDTIHVVSHGSEGLLDLGKTKLSTANLNENSTLVEQIGSTLRERGDILLYGCNVADGMNGERFLSDLATLTGADIAASSSPIGSTGLGGDWHLEVSTGKIESSMVFHQTVMSEYHHLLNTIYVNSSTGNDDTGDGTSANPYNTFTKGYSMVSWDGRLDLTGTFTWTDADETGDAEQDGFRITKSITIKGQGGGGTVIQAAASSGAAISRLFCFADGLNVTFQDLEMRYGKTYKCGGALYVSTNYYHPASVAILNCYIHDNTSGEPGVYESGGGVMLEGSVNLSIINSTISDNSSYGDGGGIYQNLYSTLTLTNSTICNNNSGYRGGGIIIWTSSVAPYITNITNCTIAGNSADRGGGVFQSQSIGNVNIKNTIIADNIADDSNDYYYWSGSFADNGYNIIEYYGGNLPPSLAGTTKTGDQTNLKLSSTLAGNGTFTGTPTLALPSGSVAINAGDSTANGSISVPSADQRGLARNGIVDIGAYEYGGIVPVAPEVITDPASSVSTIGATLNGSINANNGSTVVTFEYGTTTSYGTSVTASQSPVSGAAVTSVSYTLSGLMPNTTYHYRVVGENIISIMNGLDNTFTTSAMRPAAITNPATSATSTGAILNGSINANNASTEVTFEYGTTTSYGTSAAAMEGSISGTSATSVSYALTGLMPNTTYHFRVAGENVAGTTNGLDRTFTTSVTPTAITNPATSTTSTGAILNGSVNANNAITAVTFEYGTTTSYGASAPAMEGSISGTSATSVSYALTGLIPNTTYHYRVRGVNAAGTTNGFDGTFTTPAVPPAAITNPVTSATSTGAILNGSVNANNASTAVIFEYGTTTSYGTSAAAIQSPVNGTSETSVTYDLTGLIPNTTYHYRVAGKSIAGTTNGLDSTFTTSVTPTAVTNPVTGTTSTGAILNGSINGNNASTAVIFEYGTTASYGTSAAAIEGSVSGTSATTVSYALTGLIPNTTYHFRVVGVNTAGTTNGLDDLFTTSAVTPTAITNPVTNATTTGAILNGSVNANNASTVVTFEYGTTASYGISGAAIESPVSGAAVTSVSYTLTGLTANTTYHYRVVGVN
ncbi:MAG TPA: DUF4347 domain-containing protein, partial [Anaerovoracaceae bacterium]|nr:DUF4347 domain-containing protein [Anaerovoracaceae bacterium]